MKVKCETIKASELDLKTIVLIDYDMDFNYKKLEDAINGNHLEEVIFIVNVSLDKEKILLAIDKFKDFVIKNETKLKNIKLDIVRMTKDTIDEIIEMQLSGEICGDMILECDKSIDKVFKVKIDQNSK